MHEAARVKIMFRWVLLSIALHVMLSLIFADFLPSTVATVQQGQLVAIEAMLQSKQETPQIKPSLTANEIISRMSAPRLMVPASNKPKSMIENAAPVFSESVLTAITPAVTKTAEVGEASTGAAQAKPVEHISQDGLREYRLNLSREARRYKRYPALARQRGLEGVVIIVVSTSAGLPMPQVSLSRSSGLDVLDRQAMEMLGLAVRAAILPDSLRGRDFALDLPIHFSLDE
jgi:TonB family protein